MSDRPTPVRDWLKGLLAEKRTIFSVKRRTKHVDEEFGVQGSVEFDEDDEGLVFRRPPDYNIGVYWRVRGNIGKSWLGQKIRRLFK